MIPFVVVVSRFPFVVVVVVVRSLARSSARRSVSVDASTSSSSSVRVVRVLHPRTTDTARPALSRRFGSLRALRFLLESPVDGSCRSIDLDPDYSTRRDRDLGIGGDKPF